MSGQVHMIVASISVDEGSFRVEIQTDGDPHPDLLDEVVTRCRRLFLETQAAMPDQPDQLDGEGSDDATT